MTAADRLLAPAPSAPRVLVLLASYNGRAWIEEQLLSILSQRGVAVDVLVSDDCSTDGTAAFVEQVARCDERVHLLPNLQPSGSAGANFRRLFARAQTAGHDFVALADQDDLWLDDKLLRATSRLVETGAAGYSSAVTAFWPDGKERLITQDPMQRAADFLFEGAGQGCTFVMGAAFFREVSEFCHRHPALAGALHYHDWLVYALARLSDRTWIFDGESRIRYRQHASNEIGARGGKGAARSRLARIRDGWYRAQVAAVLDIQEALAAPSPTVARLRAFFDSRAKPSWAGHAALASLLLRHSRRRLIDRYVLAAAAFAGWLDARRDAGHETTR